MADPAHQRAPAAGVAFASDVPPALAEWIDRLLVKEPARRPSSASEAADTLESLLIDILGPRWRRFAALADPPPAHAPRVGVTDGRRSAIAPMPGPYTPPPREITQPGPSPDYVT